MKPLAAWYYLYIDIPKNEIVSVENGFAFDGRHVAQIVGTTARKQIYGSSPSFFDVEGQVNHFRIIK